MAIKRSLRSHGLSASDPRVTIYEPTGSPSTPRSPSTTRSSARPKTEPDADPRPSSDDLCSSDGEEPKKRARARPSSAGGKRPAKADRAPARHPPPPEWQTAYDMIRAQRAAILAPVDTMGCDNAGAHDPEAIAHLAPLSEREQRFSVLVSLMLSSQTKDEVTAQAMQNLRLNLRDGFSVESVARATDDELRSCINKVGFWRKKSEYIKQAAVDLVERHKGDVPKTLEELVALKGVGPKMGLLCLSSAWDINVGIAVDTHVHRISNRLGWHRPATEKVEDTQSNLESWLPKHLHREINYMLVGFGQVICLPTGPRCDLCSLATDAPGLCPSQRDVSKARQGTSSPRKLAPSPFKKQDDSPSVRIAYEAPSPLRFKTQGRAGTGLGLVKAERGEEVAVEGQVKVEDRADGGRVAVEERRVVAGSDDGTPVVKTELIIGAM